MHRNRDRRDILLLLGMVLRRASLEDGSLLSQTGHTLQMVVASEALQAALAGALRHVGVTETAVHRAPDSRLAHTMRQDVIVISEPHNTVIY